MKQILVCLSILVVFMFPFSTVAQAETVNNLEDFKQYESFQKRYYDHATELIYYSSTAYKSNEHYFKENMDLFRQAANEMFDLQPDGFMNDYLNSAESLFTKPVAFLSTLNDVRKKLFASIKSFFGQEEYVDDLPFTLILPDGYAFHIEGRGYLGINNVFQYYNYVSITPSYSSSNDTLDFRFADSTNAQTIYLSARRTSSISDYKKTLFTAYLDKHFEGVHDLTDTLRLLENFGQPRVTIVNLNDKSTVPYKNMVYTPGVENVFNNIIDSYNTDNIPEGLLDYIPTVQPQLVCPTGVVPLDYQQGTFKTKDGQLVTIDNDEQANYLQELCNLDFSFPEIYYHDDTNKLLVGGQDFSGSSSVVPIENSLVEYVRNSYNYATSVINSGVNGLKSIVAGTAGLVTFSGSLFGFLPPELLTLFIGGFSVALGLWVFKK